MNPRLTGEELYFGIPNVDTFLFEHKEGILFDSNFSLFLETPPRH
jgi:hypothetical protein